MTRRYKEVFLPFALIGGLFFSTSPAIAQSQIAACENLKGYIYYPYISPVTKDKSGWIKDSITGGRSILIKNTSGQLDIIFIDSIRNTPISSIEEGGKVIMLRKSFNQIAVLISYDAVSEIYTYWKTDDGQLQYSLIQSKGGLVSKSGAMIGTCQFINFNY